MWTTFDWIGLDWIGLDWIEKKNNKSGHNTNTNKSTMNCLALLAHCHRTGTRIRILEHSGSNANNHDPHHLRTRVANVMEASLYDRSPVRTVITPEAMQHLLQTAAFVHADADADRVCPITQAEFAEGDAALALPCGHVFIRDAIQTWLETESAECPVCRHALPSREVITPAAAAALDAE